MSGAVQIIVGIIIFGPASVTVCDEIGESSCSIF